MSCCPGASGPGPKISVLIRSSASSRIVRRSLITFSPVALDFGTLKDLERVAVQFTADLRKLAMQSTAVGENVITDLRTILEEALERIKTEIFGPEQGEPGTAGPQAPAQPEDEGKDSPA